MQLYLWPKLFWNFCRVTSVLWLRKAFNVLWAAHKRLLVLTCQCFCGLYWCANDLVRWQKPEPFEICRKIWRAWTCTRSRRKHTLSPRWDGYSGRKCVRSRSIFEKIRRIVISGLELALPFCLLAYSGFCPSQNPTKCIWQGTEIRICLALEENSDQSGICLQ